jgi:prepilin-type processing-associated H-X9-DG protein/prepilin-type N-terminal cleavage/methylation domain-containing protein
MNAPRQNIKIPRHNSPTPARITDDGDFGKEESSSANPPSHRRKLVSGFTMVELLAAVSLISALAVFTMAATTKGKKMMRSAVCQSNMHQLGIAFSQYVADNQAYPPGSVWDRHLASYLGLENSSKPMKVLRCPEDQRKRPDARSYTASSQKEDNPGYGVFSEDSETMSLRPNQIERPARTVLLSEYFHKDNAQCKVPYAWSYGWLSESNVPKLPDGSYYHGNRMNLLFADGHVESCKGEEIYKVPGVNSGRWRAFQP